MGKKEINLPNSMILEEENEDGSHIGSIPKPISSHNNKHNKEKVKEKEKESNLYDNHQQREGGKEEETGVLHAKSNKEKKKKALKEILEKPHVAPDQIENLKEEGKKEGGCFIF